MGHLLQGAAEVGFVSLPALNPDRAIPQQSWRSCAKEGRGQLSRAAVFVIRAGDVYACPYGVRLWWLSPY